MSGRSSFIAFSVAAHAALAFGLGKMHVRESHAATAIEIANLPKAKKEPPKAIDLPEAPKRAPRAVAHRSAAPPPAPVNTPPPPPAPARAALSDAAVPDFGLSLSGAIGGDGVALPPGGVAAGAPVAAHAAPVRRALSASVAQAPAAGGCEEPVVKPHPLSVPQPAYNPSARAAGIEGKVRVRLTVDESGHVVDVSVISGLGYGLDEAALAAAREAAFEPATQCGKPVRATFTISMRFTAG